MGEVHPVFVFEVAQGIDLDRVERVLGAGSARQTFRHRGRATSLFQYRPAPLRVSQEQAALSVGAWTTDAVVDLVLYDFGAASVAYRLPVSGGLEALHSAAVALRATDQLRRDAQARVEALLRSVAVAVQQPRVLDFTEDYLIFGLREAPEQGDAERYIRDHADIIAAMLRGETGPMSEAEIRNATEVRIGFGPGDITIVDWEAAFVLDPDPEDVRSVLEFANVQLLEMRWLDLQLDQALERSYQLLARGRGWRALVPRVITADLNQVAGLQLESAVMLERLSNALKVFGEEYLARIYRLAAGRFELGPMDAALTRKLATIESIYQKLSDRANTLRMEVLEWVVILLIATEIVLGLLRP